MKIKMSVASIESDILTDAEKLKIANLLPRLEFVYDLITCDCIMCHGLLLDHWRLPCQHVICYNCWQKIEESTPYFCYIDGCEVQISQLTKCTSIERELAKIQVYCLQRISGCTAILTLKSFLKHDICSMPLNRLQKSLQEKMDWPNKEKFDKKWLEFFDPLKTRLSIEEPKSTKKETIANLSSVTETENEIVDDFEKYLRNLQDKEETFDVNIGPSHQLINDKSGTLLEPTITYKSSAGFANVQVKIPRKAKESKFDFTINNWKENCKRGEITSEFFSIGDSMTRVRLKIVVDDGCLLFFLLFKPSNCNISHYHRRTLIIVHPDKEKSLNFVEDMSFGSAGWVPDHFESFPRMEFSILKDLEFFQGDCLKVSILIEPLIQIFKKIDKFNFRYNKTSVIYKWTVDNLKDKISAERLVLNEGIVCRSGCFYTSSLQGYRTQAVLTVKDNRLNIHLDFLLGEYDKQLPCVFKHQTSFIFFINEKKNQQITKIYNDVDGHLFGDFIQDWVPITIIELFSQANRSLSIKICVESLPQ